ncbi:transporter substrate-binding domain-containing protein [Streptococcus loxodontisalivarius]|uniref:L-cystine transport system substrate-binding protein n=1 Tax=Streptococcus loxodontisalivarius TaxID=1349415 RepID=A0ABS2PRW9_9STRE|nr:transporter substrate-binding domain-containing protein [Streptococcus loxodontisalivarius]MBM7642671.1 L-cystine transport system substrate-binding protein [Streptococcus loxodontisalivarius]
MSKKVSKWNWKKSLGSLAILALIGGGLYYGLSSNSAAGDDNASNDADAKTVVIGTGSNFRPFVYQDADGNDTGYEIALLKAIDDELPQYKFEIEHYEFSNLFPALENGKIDIIANQIETNEERRAEYDFSQVGYTNYDLHIQSLTGGYESLDDLKGKKVYAIAGGNAPAILEAYLEENPGAFEIVYGSWSDQVLLENFKNGTVDATLATKYTVDYTNQQLGSDYQVSDTAVNESSTYYLFRKDDEDEDELNEAVSQVLKEFKEDGTLQKISEKYLGGDYTN